MKVQMESPASSARCTEERYKSFNMDQLTPIISIHRRKTLSANNILSGLSYRENKKKKVLKYSHRGNLNPPLLLSTNHGPFPLHIKSMVPMFFFSKYKRSILCFLVVHH